MIEIEKQLFKMYSSLEKLESLDKHYYRKEDFSIKNNRLLLKCDLIDTLSIDFYNNATNNYYKFMKHDMITLPIYDFLFDRVGMLNSVTIYRYIDSYRKKTIRLQKRIRKILRNDNCFFLTFTFDDRKLKKGVKDTKHNVLRKYVTQWLRQYCLDYVGNIDFGGLNGRVHFHCVCSSIEPLIEGKSWKYGALNFKKIVTKDERALSLYVNKLCSHALKDSTKNQYLIYPKKR